MNIINDEIEIKIVDNLKNESKFKFGVFDVNNLKDLPLNKKGICIIGKKQYNTNLLTTLYCFPTENLKEFIVCNLSEEILQKQEKLIKELNNKFNTKGNCILFCELNQPWFDLDNICTKIKDYQINNIKSSFNEKQNQSRKENIIRNKYKPGDEYTYGKE